jgi:hypothetical protein
MMVSLTPDHHLAFSLKAFIHLNLRQRADQDDGLART